MTSLWTDPATIEIRRRDVLRVKAENAEDLLVAWLNELLLAVSAKKIIYREFRILSFKEFEVKAEALGQKIRSGKPEIFREIKAVTYHDLKIRRSAGVYSVRMIFDI